MDVFDLMAKLSLDKSNYEEGMEDAESSANSFGSSLTGKLGKAAAGAKKGLLVMSGATAAVGAAAVGAAVSTAKYGDSVDKNSQKLGISAKAYQEWDAVLQHSGSSIDSMGMAFRKLSSDAEGTSEDAVKAFNAIGLSMEEVSSMSTEELWEATITGLQNVSDGAERSALATDLFGKSAQELAPLLNTSAEDTQAMIDKVNELGGVMSDDAVKSSAAFQDSLQDLTTGFAAIKNSVGTAVMPVLTKFMNFGIEAMPTIQGAFEIAFSGISAIVDAFGTAGGAVFDAIKGAIDTITDALPDTQMTFDSVWGAIGDIITEAGTIIGSAITTVGNVIAWLVTEAQTDGTLINRVFTSMQSLIGAVTSTVTKVIQKVIDIFNSLKSEAQTDGSAVNTAFTGMKNTLNIIINGIVGIINIVIALLNGDFQGAWTTAKETAITMVLGLRNSVEQLITGLKDKIKENIDNIMKFFGFEGLDRTVADVFGGISKGITTVMDDVKSGVKKAIDKIKGFFDFKWELPKIKLPHFTITGHFSLNPPSAPSFGIDWFKKAMDEPYMLNGATIFGMAGGKFLGGGESGQEMIFGKESLLNMIKDAMRAVNGGGGITMNIYGAEGQNVEELAQVIEERLAFIVNRREAAWA